MLQGGLRPDAAAAPAPPGRAEPMLVVEALTKRYPGSDRAAVDGLSFTLAAGEILGLLGPNGAGKSTTIACLTTKLPMSGGDIRIAGTSLARHPVAARRLLGVAGQSNSLDAGCSVLEGLYLHCRYHGMTRRVARAEAAAAVDRFGLGEVAGRRPASLSGGQARRVQLARAVAHGPALLLLDEPTNELDPPSRDLLWEAVGELRTGGTAVLLATHYLDEAERHCDRVVIVNRGQAVIEGAPPALRERFRGSTSVLVTTAAPVPPAVVADLQRVPGVVRCTAASEGLLLLMEEGPLPLRALAAALGPVPVAGLATRQASLEEIFRQVIAASGAGR